MFSVLWRFMPGPVWLRVFALIIMAAVLVYAMITFVYPWATTVVPQPDSTLNT